MLQWRQDGEAVEMDGAAIGAARAAELRAARAGGAAAHGAALHAPDALAARYVSPTAWQAAHSAPPYHTHSTVLSLQLNLTNL